MTIFGNTYQFEIPESKYCREFQSPPKGLGRPLLKERHNGNIYYFNEKNGTYVWFNEIIQTVGHFEFKYDPVIHQVKKTFVADLDENGKKIIIKHHRWEPIEIDVIGFVEEIKTRIVNEEYAWHVLCQYFVDGIMMRNPQKTNWINNCIEFEKAVSNAEISIENETVHEMYKRSVKGISYYNGWIKAMEPGVKKIREHSKKCV